jgi:hypothetical protein
MMALLAGFTVSPLNGAIPLVGRRLRVMLVRDAPVAVNLPQAHSQSKEEPVFVRWVARRVWTAIHDRGRKRDVFARGHGEFLDVKGRSELVIAEEQVPGLFVGLDALTLQGRWQVEHHHVRLVMSEDGGKIMPADRIRPIFEKGGGTLHSVR